MYIYQTDKNLAESTAVAIALHKTERRITMQSIKVVGELERGRAHLSLEMSVEEFARHIGLSPSQYWKRARVALMLLFHPEVEKIFTDGEVEFSHLAMIAGRITPANEAMLIEGIRNKTKREVESFISRVNNKGQLTDREGFREITLRLTKPQWALIDRVKEVLTEDGVAPTNAQLMVKVSQGLIDHLEPLTDAERSAEIKRIQDLDLSHYAKDEASEKGKPCEFGSPETFTTLETERQQWNREIIEY